MDTVVRTQIFRILTVYAGLVALVVWQNHFVASGIEANPYLNLLIIGVFLFGSAKGISTLGGLANEGVALKALKEAYGDAVSGAARAAEDPLWRHERCLRPARRFRRPSILGPIYDLALDEIRRSTTVHISLDTMHNLLSTVDRKIEEERSLLGYLTGLCIFLGLIGTFIGLMEMVGSVGGIIGGLARTEDASPDTIKQLIRDLEAPLVGMATGFSASLFGLFSSMVLGLLGRFTGRAMSLVREELETWLAGMASIENERQERGEIVASRPDAAGPRPTALLGAVTGSRRTQRVVDRATQAISLVADRQTAQNSLLAELCRRFDGMAGEHRVLHQALAQSLAASRDFTELRGEVRTGLDALQQRLDHSVERLEAAVGEQAGALGHRWTALEERQHDVLGQVLRSGQSVAGIAQRAENHAAMTAARLAEDLRALRSDLGRLETSGAAAAERAEAGHERLATLVATAEDQRQAEAAARRRDAEQMAGRLDQLRQDLANQADAQRTGLDGTNAVITRIAADLAEADARRAADLGARLDGQKIALEALGSEVAQASARLQELATSVGSADAVRAERDVERELAGHEVLDRLARHQSELAQALQRVAEAASADRGALIESLHAAVATGYAETARALTAQTRDMGSALARLAEQQLALGRIATESLDGSALAQGFKAIGETLDRRLEQGFEGIDRSIRDSAEAAQMLAAAAGSSDDAGADDGVLAPPGPIDLTPYLPRLFALARDAVRA